MKWKRLFYLLIALLSIFRGYGQLSPSQDDNWILNILKSDEFNDTICDKTKWDILDPPSVGFNWGNGGQLFIPANVLFDGNCLKLKADICTFNPNKVCSGGIQSENRNYGYGYYEIRAQLPGYNWNGQPCGYGFWPAFWTYYQVKEDNCIVIHDEIDILEPDGLQYASANVNVCGWHDENNCEHSKIGEGWYTSATPLFVGFHKYAVEWLPDRIIYYFDDEPFFENYNSPSMVMQSQYVVIDFQLDGWHSPYSDTPWPQYMNVDYFRYYELDNTHCNDVIMITSVSQLYNINGVCGDIIIGDGENFIDMLSNTNKTLRASNNIIINNGFCVPLGCELNIIPTPCSN